MNTFTYLVFFNFFPYCVSWSVIIIIALDRVLLITKGYTYKKYITIKNLYCVTIFAQFPTLTLAINLVMEDEYLEEISFVLRYTLITGEVFIIIITIVAYMYLFYFVRLKSQEIANARHGRIDFDKKVDDVHNLYLHLFASLYLPLFC